jgi:hypothetical protein
MNSTWASTLNHDSIVGDERRDGKNEAREHAGRGDRGEPQGHARLRRTSSEPPNWETQWHREVWIPGLPNVAISCWRDGLLSEERACKPACQSASSRC